MAPSCWRSRSVAVPLKSNRCAISFRAWLNAFSTSIRFSSETMSKLGMSSLLLQLQHDGQYRRLLRALPPEPAPHRQPQHLLDLAPVLARLRRELVERAQRLA